MEKEYHEQVKIKLRQRPQQLIELDQWLFVTINTAKSMIDNTDKTQFDFLKHFSNCDTTRDIQQLFDRVQGKFGNRNFSQRHNPKYLYLCSLVANFPQKNLSSKDKQLIRLFTENDKYLLYEI